MARLTLVESTKRANREVPAHRASATEGEAAIRLLVDQGYPIKRITHNEAECACPFHQGPGPIEPRKPTVFYINAVTSTFFCHSASCGERGNLKMLERFFGVGEDDSFATQFHSREEQLREFEQALTKALRGPFYDHGLSDVTIERFRLGWDEAKHRYVIPYLESRRPKWFRYYQPNTGQPNYDPRWKYTWEEGAQTALFNAQDAMGDKDGRVILCESEQKAMMLVQLGYAAVGVPGAGQWRDEFQAAFTHARHIVICYDNDNPIHHIYDKPERRCPHCTSKGLDRCAGHNPGQDAAVTRLGQLGWRAKNVVLPLPDLDARKTDINDYFMRDAKSNADFALLVTGKRATPFKVQSFAEITASPPVEAAFLVEQGILPKAGRLLVAGRPKIGKSQPNSSKVLTPRGWTPMGTLKPGAQVIGSDGRPVTVTHVWPQGVLPVYRITTSDGVSVRASGDHLWPVRTRRSYQPREIVDTSNLKQRVDAGSSIYLQNLSKPVEFEYSDFLPIDPYALGALIGDGSFRMGSPSFTSGDEEMFKLLEAALPDFDLKKYRHQACYISDPHATRVRENRLKTELKALGLWGHRSETKFIPGNYLRASTADRLALLQGLMDTDGGMESMRSTYSSASLDLAQGVQEIVESLGGVAKITRKVTTHLDAHIVNVRLPGDMCPFRLQRKVDAWLSTRPVKTTTPIRRIVSITLDGEEECKCITVDAPDSLYVTEHYIVTHNSIFVDNMALSLAAGIPFLNTFEVDHPTRTLLLDREMSKWSLFARINQLTEDRPAYKTAFENLLIDHDYLLRFDQPNAYDTLLQLVEQNGAEVVILDTAYKFFAGDVESSSALMKGFEVLDKVIHETDCSFVLTHHIRKGQAGKGNQNTDVADPEAVAGSFLWTGWPNATILLNFLNRSVEDPFNAVCTFTAFRDHAAPEPLALYRDRESISYSAITPYSHEDGATTPSRRSVEQGRPTTDAVGKLLLELSPVPEDDFLHMTAAHFGVTIPVIKPYYLDVMSSGHFEKTKSRPTIIKYRYAEETESWEHEHHLPERPIAVGSGIEFDDPGLFDAAVLL